MTTLQKTQEPNLSIFGPFVLFFLVFLTILLNVLDSTHQEKRVKELSAPILKWYNEGGALSKLPQLNISLVQEGLKPNLKLSGQGAQAITIEPVYMTDKKAPEFTQTILVRTQAGNYFTVDLFLSSWRGEKTLEDCSKSPASCANFEPMSVNSLTPEEAKVKLFHASTFTPQVYQKFFNELPPASEKVI